MDSAAMIQFEWFWAFAFLPLPWIVRAIVPPASQGQGAALKVPFYAVFAHLTQPHALGTGKRRHWHHLLATVIWLLLVSAAARPQWLGAAIELPVSGRDMLLAVDLSGSMQREDMGLPGERVDRLTAAKVVLGQFIQRREGDRVGLILFGSRAYLHTPLTFDRKTVFTMLMESSIGLAGKETALGDAIGLAVKRLRERPENQRVLILLTDGANNAGEIDPHKAAELAAHAGVKIYTVGVGAEEMIVSGGFTRQRINPAADLDETTLRAIAATTGGQYFRAKDRAGLENIYAELDRLEAVESDYNIFRPLKSLYFWPVAAALFLVLLWALVSGRRYETS
jgi:Ca-activated chloride channel homolog